MRFSTFLTAGTLAAAPIHAALTADDVVQDIQNVADASSALTEVFDGLTLLDYSFEVPQAVAAFENIITALETFLSDLGLGALGGSANGGSSNSTAAASKRPRNSQIHHRRQLPSLPSSQPVFTDKADAYYVCQTFRQFVIIHQQLLSTVIGQHGLLAQTPLTAPIGAVLRTLESVVDTTAFAIIALAPPCAATSSNDKNNLDQTLQEAVGTYS